MKNTGILFIDSAVENYEILLRGVVPGMKAVVLDPNRDGVAQITEVLSQHQELQSVHIVSHGAPGTLYLGNSTLELSNLERYELQNWFPPSSPLPLPPSSLLLYGCNVAAGDAGAEFIAKLHQLTGANITASASKTGNAALGGDWNLEVNTGSIPQPLAFATEVMAVYPSVLGWVAKGSYNTPGSARGVTVDATKNLAYVADGSSGLSIIDITDPTKPTLKGTYDTPGIAENVTVDATKNLAYVADYDKGLQIIDISTPGSPTLKGTYDTPSNAYSVAVDATKNLAYVADNSSVQIIDISTPGSPTLKGKYDTPQNFASGITIDTTKNLAYVAEGNSGLLIIDISTPGSPTFKGKYNNPGLNGNITVDAAKNLAYVVEGDSGLLIIDITDPTKPTLKGTYDTPGYALGVSIDTTKNLAYVGEYDSGLFIIDISTPGSPTLKGTYNTSSNVYGVTVDAAKNLVYVVDDKSGLQIFSNNTLPTAANKTVTTSKNILYSFKAEDFSFVDTDSDSLKEVQITTAPTVGEFFLDANSNGTQDEGEGITTDKKIAAAELTKLKFKSATDATGTNYASFQFKVSDGYEYSSDAYTTSFNINSAPTDLMLNAISFNEKVTAGIQVATFSSIDSDKDDKYTYSLVTETGNTDNDAFTIEGNSLKIKASATKSTYNLRVRTTDAGGLFFDKDLAINFKDINLSTGTTESTKITQLIKSGDDTFSFKSKSDSGKVKISVKIAQQSSKSVNELSVFTVDDAQGTINGIAPGAAGYAEAALARAKVICSPVANLPTGFSFTDLSSVLEFNSTQNVRFFTIENSTTNAVLSGQTSISKVMFSSSTNFKAEDLGEEGFSIDFKGAGKNAGDLKIKIKATDDELPLGSSLQGKSQGELLDFREVKTKVKAEFTLHREAAFNNLVGFYRVGDENGGIDSNNDGTIDLRPGDAGYAQAAVKLRVTGMDLSVKNQTTATFSGMFEAGAIFAPFIIANGTAEALLDSNSANDPKVYFSFLGANTGKVDHIRMLGNNTFGFEDQAMGGDKDYNDQICQMKFTPVM